MRKALLSLSEELGALNTAGSDKDAGKEGVVDLAGMTGWGTGGPSSSAARAWLDYQAQILDGASQIRSCCVGGRSVLIHCTDGWDRTPQLTATSQLLLDGHYRTISGFVALVQREWLDFGHTFSHRCHFHGEHAGEPSHEDGDSKNRSPSPDDDPDGEADDHEFSPIFLQWIETVWQLLIQFPDAFEFKESLLLQLVDAVYSCGKTYARNPDNHWIANRK